jgi:predicted TIM-barrel fold metal-dependent hydrolase
MSCCGPSRRAVLKGLALAALPAAARGAAAATPYAGPLIDAHSHLNSPGSIEPLIAAMDRHRIAKVALLGVGGVQKDDPAWIAKAAERFPDRVIAVAPVPDPMAADAARRLEQDLASGRYRGAGEVHVHQASRKIRRAVDSPTFRALLDVCAGRGVPFVIHDELSDGLVAELEAALAQNRKATIVLAHAGSAEPAVLAGLLGRHENLQVDLSGMHFQRTPALATETGSLTVAWRGLLTERADRFLAGIDLWAPALFAPAMLDRLMTWTRRILGELPPAAAEQIAQANAVRLYRLQ